MAEANIVGGLVGEALIGLAAVLLLGLNGRIAGISGILGGLITARESGERFWRLAFVLGLIGGPLLIASSTASCRCSYKPTVRLCLRPDS